MERLIKPFEDNHCRHPEHEPASMIVRKPGEYEHICPGCGARQTFEVPLVTF